MSTEIGLKRFDKRSFKSGEVERSTFSSKDGEFGVTVLAGTKRGFQKMLSNSRIMSDHLRSAVFLADTGKIRAILGRIMVSNRPGNMLFNAFLQPLECTSYVPTIAVAHKLINNIIVDPYLLKNVLLSTSSLLKLCLSNLFNLISVDIRNFLTI